MRPTTLRDADCCVTSPSWLFEELIDLCGVDYSTYGNVPREGKRFAAVSHLLSITSELATARSLLCA
jgi:NADH-quinone oxidoreductase subunit C